MGATISSVSEAGEDSIKWEALKTLLDIADYYMENFISSQEIMVILYTRHFISKSVAWQFRVDRDTLSSGDGGLLSARNSESLVSICTRYRGAKCQDPRDRVYGFRSLARICCQEAMPVDYAVPLPEIYARLILQFLADYYNDESNPEPVVTAIQKYNKLLGITTDEVCNSDFTKILQEHWRNPAFSAKSIGVTGYVEEICYVSSDFQSSFEALPFGLDETNIKQSGLDADFPNGPPEMITSHLDLALPIAQEYSSGCYLDDELSIINIGEEKRERAGVAMAFADDIQTVWRRAQQGMPQRYCATCKLAISDDHRVGNLLFVPIGTKAGSLVVQLGTLSVLVVRTVTDLNSSTALQVIGRAIFYRRPPRYMPRLAGKIRLSLSVPALLVLTVAPSTRLQVPNFASGTPGGP